ncbi:Sec1-like family protein [Tieghemostelium lacteum]|uniref:Sec1-like family protein n=1 Tax=Tieghemostelium lacteum TaxID=361077 RepID=A0A152A712_TIELA|nr:Sec1-like family protein [Tieghemostelium lacteum]|eukprot:KYR01911.1 Sec1-like family protein [Tieghemostelium lacteum]
MNTSSTSFGFDFSFSIRDKQIESINRMLKLKQNENDTSTNWQEVWKILVFDSYCSSIIAPILTKGALRNQGVTLHLQLHSDRQPIQDVPAIYFVLPTLDNIKRIAEDCKNKLYDNIYLNFASRLSNELMEELVTLTIQSDTVNMITKLYDQFINFISLEKDLFVFNQPKNSYHAFNDPTIKDTVAQEHINTVVDSLFSVLVTMGVIPIIRCPKNSTAEMISLALEKKIAQHVQQTGSGGANLFSSNNEMGSQLSSFYRPVLVILDRNIDLSVMLHHPWTYQALAHDILSMNMNKVKVDVNSSGQTTRQTYDLDSSLDTFWQQNSGVAFPSVAGDIKTHINEYTEQTNQLSQMTSYNIDEIDDLKPPKEIQTKGLGELLTQIRAKKRSIDLHTNLATALMNQIKDRQIDYFFAMEEAIITRSLVDKKELASLITSPIQGESGGRGTLEDKIRLLLIYFLSSKSIPTSEMEQYEDSLKKMGADLSSLDYFKKTKAFNDSLAIVNSGPSSGAGGSTSKTTGFIQMITAYQPVESFTNMFSQGVRSLLPKSKDLFVTRIVESIMDLKNSPLESDFHYLDPKITNKSNIPKRATPFKEAIVFVVGGGNYVEYQNLQDFSKKHNKKIIYGSTELLTSNEFLQQVKSLKEHLN